jgi:hypothetical protein
MMIDEHRTFRACIFCGRPGKPSKEHMFGKTLARRFRERFSAAQPWLVRMGAASVQGNGPILSVAPQVACEPCNNGELSRDMASGLAPLWAAIEGQSFVISPADRQALSRYWERVGLIADVMTSDHDISDEFRSSKYYARSQVHRQSMPLFSEDQRGHWLRGDVLRDMRVYLGYHRGVLGLNPTTYIAPSTEVDRQGAAPKVSGKRFLIVVGHLAVCVRMGIDLGGAFPQGMRDLSKEVGNLQWPEEVEVSYDDFLSLPNQSSDIQFARWCTRHPNWLEQIELHSREVGTFEAPPALLPELYKEWGRFAR